MNLVQGQNVGLTLRKAEVSDREDVLIWRNDLETRAYCFSSASVKPEEHAQWFAQALKSKDRLLLIGCLKEKKIGIVRFDRLEDGGYEVNINLAPSMRGQGWGTELLKQSLSWVKGRIRARIKKDNIASIQAFEKAGYVLIDTHNDILTVETVV